MNKLWLLVRVDDEGNIIDPRRRGWFDLFVSAIVCAETEEQAKLIHPTFLREADESFYGALVAFGLTDMPDDQKPFFVFNAATQKWFENYGDGEKGLSDWPPPSGLRAVCIGIADTSIPGGSCVMSDHCTG